MTAPIRSLKFWGRPMHYCDGRFWIALNAIHTIVSIQTETGSQRCHWTITESGAVLNTQAASGVKAARNAAQTWLETRAETIRLLAAKGRAA